MGRRIYIHQHTFRNLIERETAAAHVVFNALLRTKIAKMVHRYIVEDGVAFGLVETGRAIEIDAKIKRGFEPSLTRALQQLGYRSPMPQDRNAIKAVLDVCEEVVASCYEDGYFTFATSDSAASIMYDDKEKMSALRQKVNQGLSEGLTIIKGRNLVLIKQEFGVGAGKATMYSNVFSRKSTARPVKIRVLQNKYSGNLVTELGEIFAQERTAVDKGSRELYILEKIGIVGDALQEDLFD
jgi:hypothetical protein